MAVDEKNKVVAIHVIFVVFILLYCAYQVAQWSNISHSIDLISYLDVGDAYWRGDFRSAINHYWSPMYSWILGGVLAVFHPGIDSEMVAVRTVNFVLMMALVASSVCFAKQLWQWLSEKLESEREKWLSEELYWVYIYSLISFSSLCFGGCDKDTPDVLVASFILLASAAFLKIKRGSRSPATFVAMGAMLGLGYLAKAIVLPISVFYYVAAWWELRKESGCLKKLAAALATQLCLVLPFIIAISTAFGHLTISDSSRTLALYSNNQNDQQVHFQFPELKHRSNKIFENPDVYEFSQPFNATYPPWYNPAYWTEGAPDKDAFGRPFSYLAKNANFFLLEIFSFALVCWVLSSIFLRRSCFTVAGLKNAFGLMLPALVAFLVYAITANLYGHFMERYFIAWIILLYASLVVALRFAELKGDDDARLRRYGRAARVFLIINSLLMMVVTVAMLRMHYLMPSIYSINSDAIVAHKARELGLQPGDKIAQLGFRRYYWARLAKLHIVADIFDVKSFWQMEPRRRLELQAKLRELGVKAIIMTWAVSDEEVPSKPEPGWQKAEPTKALIYLIPQN